jgi:peptide/nickel transport system substrate-binding protein
MLDRRAMLGAALAYPAQAWAVPKRTPGGRRIINAMMFEDPAHLNYPLSNTRIMQEICGNINESLLLFDWQFKPQPNLADSFEMSPDGLHYVFHLRRDVLWHDGVPFTAKDVAFSCGVMLPQLNPRSRASFSHIASIKTPDRYTVEFQLSQPFNAFLLSLMASSAPMMPAHIFEGTDFRTNPYNFKPIGTGPFKFADWKRGQHIHLTRNERYWRPGRPGMDEVYYRVCPTPEQRLVAMETGAVDIAMADDIDTIVTSRLLANPKLVTRTDAYNGTGEIAVMELNMRRWPFSDRRFRAAFLHAVDREFLVKAINFGMGKVAHGPIPSDAPYYDDKVLTKYPYDPARARALLDEMGCKPKQGGVRHRFGIMMIPDGGGYWTRNAQYIKQALAQVGLEVELEAVDWPTHCAAAAIGNSTATAIPTVTMATPPSALRVFICPQYPQRRAADQSARLCQSGSGPAVQRKAAVAVSRAEAQACYSRLQQILTHDVGMLWLYERKPVFIYNKRLKNVVMGPNGPSDGFGATELA